MPVRTTVDIPEPLYEELRVRSRQAATSIRALIVRAIEQTYSEKHKSAYVKGPQIIRKGKLGQSFPVDENPHDFVFS